MDEKRERLEAMAERVGRISAINPAGPKKMVTRADLAFVDAAIQLHRASMAQIGEGIAVDASNPVACDPVDVAAAVVAVAVLAYHVYNSCMIGEDLSSIRIASRLNIAPNVSLDKLIDARNQLANALGVNAL